MVGNPEELAFELKVTGPQHALGKLLAPHVAPSPPWRDTQCNGSLSWRSTI
jgi:hypothetical protein